GVADREPQPAAESLRGRLRPAVDGAGPERRDRCRPPPRTKGRNVEPLSAPPPIRRLDPQDPTAAREAGPATGTNFVAAKRSIAAPQFSIRRMEVDKVSIHYGAKEAVKEVSLPIRQGEVLSLIGPSGCGKTTLLRSLNRLTELTAAARLSGSIRLDDVDIRLLEPTLLRRR